MDYEILIIGTELTSAQSEDKNARYIIEKLFKNGFECKSVTILPDEIRTIARGILNALYQSDILIISGGLGPTFDDVTREAISEATGKQLIFSQEIAEKPQTALKQARFPEGATLIPATLGTAPGIILEIDQKLIVALPGVPAEMRKILNENVVPFLAKKYLRKETILLRTIKTCGVGEVFVEKEIEKLIKKYSDVTTTILAHQEEVHIKLMVKNLASEIAKDSLSAIEKDLVECLGDCVFGYDEDTLESVVGKLLK
ncbi:MAG: molybdopterin-binding protein, partial [Candidatus Subteraquimicrobiales bacterium]|nr:molybdopterin-binding protein [Candidatus Subteraquimicrobiales bacterium]